MVENGTVCLTVLLVEDFDDSRYVIKRALEMRGGYRVVEAVNGQEAVEIVRRECPDMILMDLNLPLMDGLTATRYIRDCKDACQTVPIVAITAYDAYGMEEAAIEAGCDAYIPKPVDFDELDRTLRRLLLGW
jgi:CheY-like chemotaxis protein